MSPSPHNGWKMLLLIHCDGRATTTILPNECYHQPTILQVTLPQHQLSRQSTNKLCCYNSIVHKKHYNGDVLWSKRTVLMAVSGVDISRLVCWSSIAATECARIKKDMYNLRTKGNDPSEFAYRLKLLWVSLVFLVPKCLNLWAILFLLLFHPM